MDLAAAWSWRFLVIVAAGYLVLRAIGIFELVVLPLVIALLLAALAAPLVNLLHRAGCRAGWPPSWSCSAGIGLIALLLTFAGQQVAQGANDLAKQVVDGIEQIRTWLKTGPLHASDSQINDYLKQIQEGVTSGNKQIVTRVTEVGTAVGHIVAGVLHRAVRDLLLPRRRRADLGLGGADLPARRPRPGRLLGPGRLAVADQVRAGHRAGRVRPTRSASCWCAAILKVPFVFAIGVLVFIGAFIPMIGALLSGSVAVLVALVAHGPIVALIMLGGVVAVQQLEAHVLQPFLLGRFVAVHPLGVIVAIGAGVLVAGIPGALVAVPLVAALNAVVLHLADTAGAPRRRPRGQRRGPGAPAGSGDVRALTEPVASVRDHRLRALRLVGAGLPGAGAARPVSGISLRNSATTSATSTSGTADRNMSCSESLNAPVTRLVDRLAAAP